MSFEPPVMTLEEFTEHLRKIDVLCGFDEVNMFCCRPKFVSVNLFSYDFDGFMTAFVKFHEDGCVSEWIEADPETDTPTWIHSSIEEWYACAVREMTEPYRSKEKTMKMKVQMFTKEGFYGPQQEVQIRSVMDATSKLVSVIEKLPDELDGVSCMDWTRITVEIVRE